MAEHDFTQRTIINGVAPITVTDLESVAHFPASRPMQWAHCSALLLG